MDSTKRDTGVWVVGISGGADSTALLHFLLERGERMVAVHCNFQLRGEESERDQHFVEGMCKRLGVELETVKFDTHSYAREHSLSLETACRELRYDFFRRMKEKYNAEGIAVAHNADDNRETLMLNLLRGSGSRGLSGMSEWDGEIWRPLLGMSRREILEYLRERGATHVDDSTNQESLYRRNFLRNEIMPLLRERWEGAEKALTASLSILEAENRLLEELAQKAVVTEGDGGFIVEWRILKEFSDCSPILARIFSDRGANRRQIQEMARAAKSQTAGKRWRLSRGEVVTHQRGMIYSETEEKFPETCIRGIPAGLNCERLEVTAELMSQIKDAKGNDELWIGTDPASHPYIWRHPRTGDRIRSHAGEGKPRLLKVSKILKDAKLDLTERKKIYILENIVTGEIIWIKGLKRSCRELIKGNESSLYHVF